MARKFNLPVFQGYGLSECGSVVSLCSIYDDIQSCGQILPHTKVRIENGELVVTGNTFLGYLEEPKSWNLDEVHTGDIARISNNMLFIEGRKKNTIINSYGRNISPEWIEAEILASGLFHQVVVVGDAKPFCIAIVVPINNNSPQQDIAKCIDFINKSLPDYAQIKQAIITSAMTAQAGLYTDNMRPKRVAINTFFDAQLRDAYMNLSEQASLV